MPSARAALLALLVSASAHALPPDARLQLAPGAEKFVRPGIAVGDVVVEPESLATAELLPSNEIFLTAGKSSGSGIVLALAADRVWVWDLCVSDAPERECPKETALQSAKAACPDLAEVDDDGQKVWKATVQSPACLAALRDALAHAAVGAKKLHLVLDETAAREFYRRVGEAVQKDPRSKGLSASYLGATLRLSGKASQRGVARALVHAYQETVGPVTYESQVSSPDSAPAKSGSGASR